jgi:hypothetical protein
MLRSFKLFLVPKSAVFVVKLLFVKMVHIFDIVVLPLGLLSHPLPGFIPVVPHAFVPVLFSQVCHTPVS